MKALLKHLEYKVFTQAVPLKVVNCDTVVAIAELTDQVAYDSTAIGDLKMRFRVRVNPRTRRRNQLHEQIPQQSQSPRPPRSSDIRNRKKSPKARQVWLSPNEEGYVFGGTAGW